MTAATWDFNLHDAINAWLQNGSLHPAIVAGLRNHVVEELLNGEKAQWAGKSIRAEEGAYCVAVGLSPFSIPAQVAARLLDIIDGGQSNYLDTLEQGMRDAGSWVPQPEWSRPSIPACLL
jgi:hypothetical protein